MGFFKKIGQGIKKFAKKNIRFSNLVKVAGMVDPSGIVGGLSAQHEQKKLEREAEAQATQEQAVLQSATPAQREAIKKINPDFGDFLGAAGSGALTGVAGVLAGTNTVAHGTTILAEKTAGNFLKRNWWKIGLGVVGVTGLVIAIVRMARPKRRGYRR